MIRKLYNKFREILLNNIIVNNFLILIKRDYLIKKWQNNWANLNYDHEKSPQENVGCSHLPELQKYADETHQILVKKIEQHFCKFNSVLDIGCGTGLYLRDFPNNWSKTGVDLNQDFLDVAKGLVPGVNTKHGDYLNLDFNEKFDLIISIGVLMYIEPSSLKKFFKKMNNDLNRGGKIFFQYSHALLLIDIYYSDLSYVRYTPRYIEKTIAPFFDVIEHKHFFDDRIVQKYDKEKYYFPNGKRNRVDTVRNSYMLIAQKK